jgi:hypothetical protein
VRFNSAPALKAGESGASASPDGDLAKLLQFGPGSEGRGKLENQMEELKEIRGFNSAPALKAGERPGAPRLAVGPRLASIRPRL